MRRIAVLGLLAAGCASDGTGSRVPSPGPDEAVAPTSAAPFDPTPWVDPRIGTGGHGHTFPGATVPFGMVQLSPDTRLEGWDGCSGYHHDDEWVYGFSHTHLQGTGCSDYGDVLLMPGVGDVRRNNGADGKPGYRQRFAHANETAEAGSYSVVLDDSNVRVELTATTRVGVHRYTFPAGTRDAHVLLDLAHRDDVIESSLSIVSDREIRGTRRSRAWAEDQRIHFVARFSRPMVSNVVEGDPADPGTLTLGGLASEDGIRAAFRFDVGDGGPLVVAVGISGTDVDGARRNLDAECPGFDFDGVRAAAREAWRRQLAKVEVRGGTEAQLRTFYTALYHCSVAPNVWGDVDGRYRGRDGRIHEAKGWTQHTVFSLWDTFRALHPLMTILEPERTEDWLNTFVAQHREGGALPVWELSANETDCMIGYHAVPVIADAWAKGIRGPGAEALLRAMVASADRDVRGLPEYRASGFVPSEAEGESVSKTLEYAYDDWCIAEMARSVGDDATAGRFGRRGQSWKNLFDPATGFFRPRRNHAWVVPFDPAEVNQHLTEANSWQYSAFVPHDVSGLRDALGGPGALSRRLDALFAASPRTTGREQADITGLIGQYAHGNEPSHHMAYLHAFDGEPWKTQERVRQILDTLYTDRPDGLCGNEDCGQMSAWYVLSALGFYPVCPGRPEYVIGTPLFEEATIRPSEGAAAFTVRRRGPGTYVQSATLDGAPLRGPVLPHAAIVRGGVLGFEMGTAPSRWGSDPADAPVSRDAAPPIVPVPFVARGDRTFRDWIEVALGVADPAAQIRYEVRGDAPAPASSAVAGRPYTSPLRFERTTTVEFWAERDGARSARGVATFVRIDHGRTIRVGSRYAPQYSANGDVTLIDGIRGGTDFRTGDWQGYQGVDLDVTIDLGGEREVRVVRAGFLQDQKAWIWMPTVVDVFVSTRPDGAWWQIHDNVPNDVDERRAGSVVKRFETIVRGDRARFVRVLARNRGRCPDWHPGAGHPAWIFADEIEVETAE